MKLTNYKIDRNNRQWYHFDASTMVFGRLCSQSAKILMGKTKPAYTPLFDSGDYVVITNASQVKLTGFKIEQKEYYHHTGYLGNMKTKSMKELLAKNPDKLFRNAIRLMLPKTPQGRKCLKKLRVYAGSEHPHVNAEFVK